MRGATHASATQVRAPVERHGAGAREDCGELAGQRKAGRRVVARRVGRHPGGVAHLRLADAQALHKRGNVHAGRRRHGTPQRGGGGGAAAGSAAAAGGARRGSAGAACARRRGAPRAVAPWAQQRRSGRGSGRCCTQRRGRRRVFLLAPREHDAAAAAVRRRLGVRAARARLLVAGRRVWRRKERPLQRCRQSRGSSSAAAPSPHLARRLLRLEVVVAVRHDARASEGERNAMKGTTSERKKWGTARARRSS